MIRSLLGGLVLLVCAATGARAAGLAQQAAEAVQARQFEKARALYEQLAETYPHDSSHRIWVARLSGWLHEYERAIATYDQVLAWDPGNIAALVGKADVLSWEHRWEEATALLDEAARVDPADPRIAAARKRHRHASAWSSILPDRPEFEGTVGYRHQDFSFAQDAHMGFVHGGYRTRRTHTFLRVEQWDKFGEESTRVGSGIVLGPWSRWTLGGEAWTDPGSDVLPEWELRVVLGRALPFGLGVGAGYRHMHFANTRVHVATGTVEYYFPFPVWLSATYHRSHSDLKRLDETQNNDTISFLYHQRLARRVTLHLGYIYGNEAFQDLSIDQVGSFQADTFHGGFDLAITPWLAAGARASYQSRDNGGEVTSMGLSLSVYR